MLLYGTIAFYFLMVLYVVEATNQKFKSINESNNSQSNNSTICGNNALVY